MKKLFITIGLILTSFTFFIIKANATTEIVDYSNKNLASPDLQGKEHLGDGVYSLYNDKGITIHYNVYNGIYDINGSFTDTIVVTIATNTLEVGSTYTLSGYKISGSGYLSYRPLIILGEITSDEPKNFIEYVKINEVLVSTGTNIRFYLGGDGSYDNLRFKLQIEKGDTATPYTVPLQPYLWHEKQLSYDNGYDAGYLMGHVEGYFEGYEFGHSNGFSYGYDKGYNDGLTDGYDLGYDEGILAGENKGFIDGYNKGRERGKEEGFIDGFNKGREEEKIISRNIYAKYYNGVWLTAEEYANIRVQQTINEIGNAEDYKIGLIGFIPAILGSIGAFFFTLASFEVMGISLMSIIALFASLAVIILIIKLIKGGD